MDFDGKDELVQFQSTRPSRGATGTGYGIYADLPEISIHAPLTGRDGSPTLAGAFTAISIHAPLTGRDKALVTSEYSPIISIHAPLTGRDLSYRHDT